MFNYIFIKSVFNEFCFFMKIDDEVILFIFLNVCFFDTTSNFHIVKYFSLFFQKHLF